MEDLDDRRFILTSAIHYMNGPPHIGHAYENIIADCIVRFYRLLGRDAYLISGSDETWIKDAENCGINGIYGTRAQ